MAPFESPAQYPATDVGTKDFRHDVHCLNEQLNLTGHSLDLDNFIQIITCILAIGFYPDLQLRTDAIPAPNSGQEAISFYFPAYRHQRYHTRPDTIRDRRRVWSVLAQEGSTLLKILGKTVNHDKRDSFVIRSQKVADFFEEEVEGGGSGDYTPEAES